MATKDDPQRETGELAAAARPRRAPKRKLTRIEKSQRTRQAICDAAAEIIGEFGYAEASIARIMERAGLGHGTFYAYF
ncbi:helix-turn-helix domain-containing protein, partial [Acinetobacter baumannii]